MIIVFKLSVMYVRKPLVTFEEKYARLRGAKCRLKCATRMMVLPKCIHNAYFSFWFLVSQLIRVSYVFRYDNV